MKKSVIDNVIFSLVMSPSINLSLQEIQELKIRILHRLRSEERMLGFLEGENEILQIRLDHVPK